MKTLLVCDDLRSAVLGSAAQVHCSMLRGLTLGRGELSDQALEEAVMLEPEPGFLGLSLLTQGQHLCSVCPPVPSQARGSGE